MKGEKKMDIVKKEKEKDKHVYVYMLILNNNIVGYKI